MTPKTRVDALARALKPTHGARYVVTYDGETFTENGETYSRAQVDAIAAQGWRVILFRVAYDDDVRGKHGQSENAD